MIEKKLKAIEVAEYFISRAKEEKSILTPKKLQKMLYYAQAWFLVFENDKLFDEKIEAWLHGPAIGLIYQEYRNFGFTAIRKEINIEYLNKISPSVKTFLSNVWKIYGKYDANYLEILSHNEEPWQKARENVGEFSASNNEINIELMKEYYTKLLPKESL